MSFLKRLFASDRRAALKAEASGDFELAAQRYVLAGDTAAVVRMHQARAKRADNRRQEIIALRDALYWAEKDQAAEAETPLRKAQCALGLALLSQSEAEGVATEHDRDRVREAAALLQVGGLFAKSGDAFLSVGETREAVRAFQSGGLVDKLEFALDQDLRENERTRTEQREFADYKLHMESGSRDQALACLRACIAAAKGSKDYRSRLEDLETRLIRSGFIELRARCAGKKRGEILRLCGRSEILLGRDRICDLVLRSGGVSRRHAAISVGKTEEGAAQAFHFELSDAGSRNGTRLAEMAIDGSLPLEGEGVFQLGDELKVHFSVRQEILHLHVKQGFDRGTQLWASGDKVALSLAPLGLEGSLRFDQGRPLLSSTQGSMTLNEAVIAQGEIQLIHGDQFVLAGLEIEVL